MEYCEFLPSGWHAYIALCSPLINCSTLLRSLTMSWPIDVDCMAESKALRETLWFCSCRIVFLISFSFAAHLMRAMILIPDDPAFGPFIVASSLDKVVTHSVRAASGCFTRIFCWGSVHNVGAPSIKL